MREFVADIGNTRIKWGECAADGIARTAALPLDDPDAWAAQRLAWEIPWASTWTLAGTHPDARDRLAAWLRAFVDEVRVIDQYNRLFPLLRIEVDFPEQVGIDRLLNAVAIRPRVARGTPFVVIDAGSAITVDLVDKYGVFRGGAIFPGYRLMAKSLRDYTARLPLVESFQVSPTLPGTNTVAAITGGIDYAIHGGIDLMVRDLSQQYGTLKTFIAGGDAELLVNLECQPEFAGPFLTLEGIRLSARNRA